MALQHKMTMRTEQRPVMTATLQQAIGLLPLTRAEMQQSVQREMQENPLLEEVPEAAADVEMPDDAPEGEGETESESDEGAYAEIDWENIVQDGYGDLSPPAEDDDFPSHEQTLTRPDTLHEHLEWQLGLSVAPEPIARTARQIIWNVNDQGYLEADPAALAAEAGLGPREAERALALVQGFDPPGVAARTLQECLLIQLKNHALSPNHDGRLVDLARTLVLEDMERIDARQYAKLARANRVEVDEVARAVLLIRSLDPYPGLRFSDQRVEVVTPDVVVAKRGDDYEVTLHDDGLPPLRVNPLYAAMAADREGTPPEARKYLEEKMRSAVWFVKCIEQRRRTILRVSRSIVRFQRDFFEEGVRALKPLVLRDVAQDIGMHESTVSRVTTGKYMDTPQGVLGFKYFFHSGLGLGAEGVASSVAVKEIIKRVVAQENPRKPLTDQRIVDRLRQDDVVIARRTVTKYRKELRILPASKRRAIHG